ncbi:MAG: peptidoglycan-binding protein [Chloroflexi bacterium]|nr:peptidoglycan-binding protein [Chloroflexota bacterium]
MSKHAPRETDTADGLTPEELAAEEVTALPDKEVVSILDLQVDADLALDLAAPVDLAVAANANVAAPIDAAVGANVLSAGSTAQALSDQGVMITQGIVGDASASATQASDIDQAADAADAGANAGTAEVADGSGAVGDATGAAGAVAGDSVTGVDAGDMLSGDLLNIDVNLAADANLTAPIAGAVAANANVAAPIDAAVAANVGSIGSSATAVSIQDAIINQSIEGDSSAVVDQDSEISQ